MLEFESLRLIDALPVDGNQTDNQIHGDCPLAFDASGTRASEFEAAAQSFHVARALRDGQTSLTLPAREELAAEAGYPDVERMGEYAACLLARAAGNCVWYDATERRERTTDEVAKLIAAGEEPYAS